MKSVKWAKGLLGVLMGLCALAAQAASLSGLWSFEDTHDQLYLMEGVSGDQAQTLVALKVASDGSMSYWTGVANGLHVYLVSTTGTVIDAQVTAGEPLSMDGTSRVKDQVTSFKAQQTSEYIAGPDDGVWQKNAQNNAYLFIFTLTSQPNTTMVVDLLVKKEQLTAEEMLGTLLTPQTTPVQFMGVSVVDAKKSLKMVFDNVATPAKTAQGTYSYNNCSGPKPCVPTVTQQFNATQVFSMQ